MFEVKSKELIISCMWDEKFIFDKDQNKIKSEKISQKEFFYISTDFNFFEIQEITVI